MQIKQLCPHSVPWTTRDTWAGVVILGLWLGISTAITFFLRFFSLNLDPGLLVSLAEFLLLAPVWWFTVRKYRVGWKTLGLRGFKGKMIGLGCSLMLLSFVFNLVYSLFLGLFNLRVQVDLVPIFTELSNPWFLLLGGTTVAPIAEEVFFRGFVFAGLRQQYSWQKAALISSALFALIHLQLTAAIPIFILGYIFAYLYYRSNSIWPAILMHVSTNALGLGTAYMLANTNIPG